MDKSRKQNHILVTGAHRSGTTFVGRMLSLPRHIGYIREPFNPASGLEGTSRWFPYVKAGLKEERHYHDLMAGLLNGNAVYKKLPLFDEMDIKQISAKMLFKSRGNLEYLLAKYNPFVNRFLIKDPIACFASEYLHKAFGLDVVVIIRHPAAFVASLKRLDWSFDFSEFIQQEALRQDFLDDVLKGDTPQRLSVTEKRALLWRCIYSVLFCYLERNPKIIGVRHEDLSGNPPAEFKALYGKLGIFYTDKIESLIQSYTEANNPVDPKTDQAHTLKRDSKGNIKRWKKVLSEDEINTIKTITGDLAAGFYDDSDW